MNKSAREVNRLNLSNLKVPYRITGVVMLVVLVQDCIKALIAQGSGERIEQYVISVGNYFWLLIPFAAIFIATRNLRRIMNLGGKRSSFFTGSLATYLLLAGFAALANTVVFYTYDRLMNGLAYFYGIFNCIAIFGWDANGAVLAFMRQFAFLALVAAAVHTLALMQDNWVGWAVDLLIAAVLGVFIPIASLRGALIGFFHLIIFQSNAFLQIICCLALAAIVYAASYPALARKRI